MRIQRIVDACELMARKDQAGTLEALTQLHVEIEKDCAGWLCDWWQCGPNRSMSASAYWHLGRMLIRITGDKLAQLETDLKLAEAERDHLLLNPVDTDGAD